MSPFPTSPAPSRRVKARPTLDERIALLAAVYGLTVRETSQLLDWSPSKIFRLRSGALRYFLEPDLPNLIVRLIHDKSLDLEGPLGPPSASVYFGQAAYERLCGLKHQLKNNPLTEEEITDIIAAIPKYSHNKSNGTYLMKVGIAADLGQINVTDLPQSASSNDPVKIITLPDGVCLSITAPSGVSVVGTINGTQIDWYSPLLT